LKKRFLERLIKERKTQKQISAELEVSQTNVRYWLKKYSLKTCRGPGGSMPKDLKSPRSCRCGELDPEKFYGHKRSICAKCHSQYNLEKGREKRKRAVTSLGGKCTACGFNRFLCSLDIHHVDPDEKDVAFTHMRSWAWSKIEKEIKKCVLLCKNCHAALHNGELELDFGT
jgi:RNase P subunit RPR2